MEQAESEVKQERSINRGDITENSHMRGEGRGGKKSLKRVSQKKNTKNWVKKFLRKKQVTISLGTLKNQESAKG